MHSLHPFAIYSAECGNNTLSALPKLHCRCADTLINDWGILFKETDRANFELIFVKGFQTFLVKTYSN